jgi:hypothetical protein
MPGHHVPVYRRQPGHKPFQRLENTPADPNPAQAGKSLRKGLLIRFLNLGEFNGAQLFRSLRKSQSGRREPANQFHGRDWQKASR